MINAGRHRDRSQYYRNWIEKCLRLTLGYRDKER